MIGVHQLGKYKGTLLASIAKDENDGLFYVAFCHAPTLSQARDNRRVNPSGVNNTVLELAQGFQTPVHTYNP